MMEFLRLLDQEILLIFNGYHTEFLDAVMWHVSHRFFWIPFYAILLAMMVMKFGWLNSLRYLICIGIIITLADQICASVLRPMFERMRPSNPDNPFSAMVTLTYGYHGGRYGFPSCHAANTMALATFISLVFRSRKLIVIMAVWSVVVSCSRMYLGVHYPSDIVTGWLIGGFIALSIYYFHSRKSRSKRQQLIFDTQKWVF